jgi:hypothetical protein
MNIARTEEVKDGYSPMIEFVLVGAAAISIAAMVSTFNKRRLAPAPARMQKRQL